MSRAYRLRVRESLRRVLRAEDHVSTQLEVLEILPCDQMADLLAQELTRRGFQRKNGVLTRNDQGVTVAIDPESATVTVWTQSEEKIDLAGEKQAIADREWDKTTAEKTKQSVQQTIRQDLEKQASQKNAKLQQQVTEKLEGHLGHLRKELDQAINRVTAEALKRKAAQLGQIKEMTEDPETGSLTIVLEV